MTQGSCWCNEEKAVTILKSQGKKIFAIDGKNAMLKIWISHKQDVAGLPIDFCPYCGRQLADGSPRCPEGVTQ